MADQVGEVQILLRMGESISDPVGEGYVKRFLKSLNLMAATQRRLQPLVVEAAKQLAEELRGGEG